MKTKLDEQLDFYDDVMKEYEKLNKAVLGYPTFFIQYQVFKRVSLLFVVIGILVSSSVLTIPFYYQEYSLLIVLALLAVSIINMIAANKWLSIVKKARKTAESAVSEEIINTLSDYKLIQSVPNMDLEKLARESSCNAEFVSKVTEVIARELVCAVKKYQVDMIEV